jgi:hypothetical protein
MGSAASLGRQEEKVPHSPLRPRGAVPQREAESSCCFGTVGECSGDEVVFITEQSDIFNEVMKLQLLKMHFTLQLCWIIMHKCLLNFSLFYHI